MKHLSWATTILLVITLGCNDPKKPSDSNFTAAINKHLMVHGKACVTGFDQFPVDIAQSELAGHNRDAERMAAFEAAGVVKSSDTVAVLQRSFNRDPIPVKRYELTTSGKKYLEQVSGMMGTFPALCYAHETVDSIVKWNEPVTESGFSMTVVTYTYRLANVADWARNDQISSQYPEIKREFDGEKVQQKTIGLQLTNKGWDSN
jgi:hypothetical protein